MKSGENQNGDELSAASGGNSEVRNWPGSAGCERM
nr:MAG TPA: hypothetical protein [Caudoviricetes sp.]DAW17596.1 MAG TPA: hypothetical protein [Caudoviricetes sp.]